MPEVTRIGGHAVAGDRDVVKGQRTFRAIFAANDQMAYGARLALFRHGLRVPDDLALVGFDDQHGSVYQIPPLTTVRVPASEMGESVAKAILQRIAGNPWELPALSAELMLRESVARYR